MVRILSFWKQKKYESKAESNKKAKAAKMQKNEAPAKKKMTYMERRDWEGIEDQIAEAEEKLELFNTELNEIGSDFELAQKLMEDIDKLNNRLEELIERWTYLIRAS